MASESLNHSISKSNGVLPITAAQAAGKSPVKVSNPKLKVVIRRLPPGLTEQEFIQILGDEWTVGRGRVDWVSYKPGKESKDPSKPSYPSRAYLHLLHNDHLMTLSDAVRHSSFEDARNTWNNSCLIGPPSVEFAPYGRVPSGKRRNDARQGTIDQDPDFMDFLESLANPVPSKEPAPENSTEEERVKGETVMTTPLVQFLKEKKANKGKDILLAAKTGKPVTVKAISKPSKEPSPPPEDAKKKGKDAKIERLVGKAAKEAVKVLTKEASNKTMSSTSSASSSTSSSPAIAQESNVKTPRAAARERGSIAAAARLIQRDLGLSPSNAHRKAKADIAASDAKAASASTSSTSEVSSTPLVSPAPPTGPRGAATESRNRGRGNRGESAASKGANPSKDREKNNAPAAPAAPAPIITLLKKPAVEPPSQPAAMTNPARIATPAQIKNPTAIQSKAQTAPIINAPAASTPSSSRQRNPPAQPTPSAGATRAFVKHANPSQGITEALLKEALEAYGATSSVEIDKRKGFAYVDFVDAEGLAKAMKANPIKIANGTVQVLERKDRESQGGGGASKSGASNVENASNAGGSGAGRNGGRAGVRAGRGGVAATGSAAGGAMGRNRGRHGRGGGGGGASASTPAAIQASSSSTPTRAAPASKEVAK